MTNRSITNDLAISFVDNISAEHKSRMWTYLAGLVLLTPMAVAMDISEVPETLILGFICLTLPIMSIAVYGLRCKESAQPAPKTSTAKDLQLRLVGIRKELHKSHQKIKRYDAKTSQMRVEVLTFRKQCEKQGNTVGLRKADDLLKSLKDFKGQLKESLETQEANIREADSLLISIEDIFVQEKHIRELERQLKFLEQQESIGQQFNQLTQLFKQLDPVQDKSIAST